MKAEIKITYTASIRIDKLSEAIEDGYNLEDIRLDIQKHGVESDYIWDYEVTEVEALE